LLIEVLNTHNQNLEKKVEERTIDLKIAKEKAEESDRLKSAFLANISHEIRTPVNGIQGFLQILSSDDLTPECRQQYIDIIDNSSAQLVRLIDDIIDISKIEAKQMVINPVPVPLNDLMKELQMFFDNYLQTNNKNNVMLVLDNSSFIDNCVALVDPDRLRQVLYILLDNAIKFTKKGFVRFGYRQTSPEQLEFVVKDTGIGLAPDLHQVIFERFRQAELTNSRLYGGTGLGLNIAGSLVQMMGGDMRVESTEGNGASFYFTILYLPVKNIVGN
jgi:signal transduction histidine kinase